MESLLIIGYIFVLIIISIIMYKNTNYCKKSKDCKNTTYENLVNLDESRKERLKKCCTTDKCYDKPSFLHIYDTDGNILPLNSCENNKKFIADRLDKVYNQMFTNEKYNKLLKDLKLRSDATPMSQDNIQRIKDLFGTSFIEVDKTIGQDIFQKIINDNTDTIPGESKNYSNFNL